ncbi:MAG TPA: hypothetical protein VN946_08635 [Terriglobales bacterium]|jgi:hypothetical protein|nr:hypothetical protein [Terriglobales bacterium]
MARARAKIVTSAFFFVLLACTSLPAANRTRYFKEDGLTGADYLVLATDGTYTLTGREHMGVWVTEAGRWNRSGAHITFAPTKPMKSLYIGSEVPYRGQTFLSWTAGDAAGIVVAVEDTKRELKAHPNQRPPYVFFEITPKVYQQETKQNYPFKTLGK